MENLLPVRQSQPYFKPFLLTSSPYLFLLYSLRFLHGYGWAEGRMCHLDRCTRCIRESRVVIAVYEG